MTDQNNNVLTNSLLTFHLVCYIQLWNTILQLINVVRKRLQSPKMYIREAASDLDSAFACLSIIK